MTQAANRTDPNRGRTKSFELALPPGGLSFRIVGLGGTGGIVARYLSVFCASLAGCPTRIALVDGDSFEWSNASRALFRTAGNKAEVVRADLLQYLADSRVTLLAIDQFVTEANVERLLPGGPGQFVILCVDNHATRKLVSDHCAGRDGRPGLRDICLISAGNDGVGADSAGHPTQGTYGNCQVYLRRGGRDVTPSLTRYHPEIERPADRLPTEVSCTEALPSTPQLLFANLMSAAAICNAVWLTLCRALSYSELIFDIAAGRMAPAPIPGPDPDRWFGPDRAPPSGGRAVSGKPR